MFVRRYIGDGSAPQAPASPAKGAPTNEDVQLPDTPLEKDVPSVKDKVQIGVPGFTDEARTLSTNAHAGLLSPFK